MYLNYGADEIIIKCIYLNTCDFYLAFVFEAFLKLVLLYRK